ncbi:MAG: translation initiation factor IF-2 [archaeon]|nr:translation initiation factor IF-2 [archaeon]
MIRKPIITVLGHVDSGKTSLLDSIRGTAVSKKEAGGITQHIGATEVPIALVKNLAGKLLEKYKFNLAIPGLLFIDTPGHEAFTNLRKRGGSIADLAILVVDINKGLEKQSIEAIDILRGFKTPFIVVANKVDTIKGWQPNEGSVSESLKDQHPNVLVELDKKIYELVGQLHSHGFVSERFDNVKDFTKEISIIPASAKKREGLPEILLFLAGLSQRYLEKKLEAHQSDKARGTVLEVKDENGIGKTIDVILYEGKLVVGEEIVVGGKNGAIETRVRALLEPTPFSERKNSSDLFRSVKEVFSASGVKVSAPGLEEALAGAPVRAKTPQAVKEVSEELKNIIVDSQTNGIVVKADTLGSLEALSVLLAQKGITIRKAGIGVVSKRDFMEAAAVHQKDPYKGVIFAFNVEIDPEVPLEAEKKGIKIFASNIIYRILEDYSKWVQEEKERQKNQKMTFAITPFRVRVLPNHVFRASKPAVVGVKVEAGKLKPGVALARNGEKVGTVREIQSHGKNMPEALSGSEVAISIEGGVFGKNFAENDELFPFLSKRQLELLEELKGFLNDEELEVLEEIKQKQQKNNEEGE